MSEKLDDLPSKMIEGQTWVPLLPVQAIVADLRATAELVERADVAMQDGIVSMIGNYSFGISLKRPGKEAQIVDTLREALAALGETK